MGQHNYRTIKLQQGDKSTTFLGLPTGLPLLLNLGRSTPGTRGGLPRRLPDPFPPEEEAADPSFLGRPLGLGGGCGTAALGPLLCSNAPIIGTFVAYGINTVLGSALEGRPGLLFTSPLGPKTADTVLGLGGRPGLFLDNLDPGGRPLPLLGDTTGLP